MMGYLRLETGICVINVMVMERLCDFQSQSKFRISQKWISPRTLSYLSHKIGKAARPAAGGVQGTQLF